jgi:hypothetical protein
MTIALSSSSAAVSFWLFLTYFSFVFLDLAVASLTQ